MFKKKQNPVNNDSVLLVNEYEIEDINNFNSDYCFFNFDYLNTPKKDIFISKLKK